MAEKRASNGSADGALVKRQRTQESQISVADGRHNSSQGIARTSDLLAPIMLLEGHEAEVYTCKFSPDGDLFASAGHDKTIFLWRVWDDCKNFACLTGHKSAIVELHWSLDGERLISASPDRSIRAWDTAKGVQVKNLTEHSDFVNSCAPLRRGMPMLVSGSDDRTIKVWDLRSKRSVQTLHDNFQVLSVCFGDAGDQVFSAGLDNTVKVWDLRKEQVLISMAGHSDSVTGMALNQEGTFLLTNGMDNTLRMWDVRPYAPANRCMKVFTGHQHNFEKNLLKCSWSSDGRRVTAGSSDRFVNVWDATNQQILYKLPGHKGSVNEATFHPTQPIIASASSDKTIFVGEISK